MAEEQAFGKPGSRDTPWCTLPCAWTFTLKIFNGANTVISTSAQSVPNDPVTISPSERLRKLGQEMGLWNHGFDFSRFAKQLFQDIDFRDKTMLEIGCGKGILCL